jgi:phosphoglycerate dehydrogenase-like enzyme
MNVLVDPDVEGDGLEIVRTRVPDLALVDSIADADAVLCYRLSAEKLAGAGRLRLVQALSAGADRIDRAAIPAGCAFCNVYEHEVAIGEWVLGAMLALAHRLVRFDRDLRRNEWHRDAEGDDYLVPELLDGRTVGTVGYGHIAREVHRLAGAFGMRSAFVRRSTAGELPRLLAESDFVVVACPETDETRGLIDRPELELIGPRGYLVNPSRGGIVEERALYEALRDDVIAGAALDTWYRYPRPPGWSVPPSAYPFHELDNVLMSPHVSGRSERTTRRRWQFVAEQLERLARGEPLENVIQIGPREENV